MKSKLRRMASATYTNPLVQKLIHAGVTLSGRDRHKLRNYLRDNSVRRLQIGAGGNSQAGWLNTNWYPVHPVRAETIFLDATKRFPFPDELFDYIATEHVIEHVPFLGGRVMLQECFRVLKRGGRIRIATPDLAFLTGLLEPDLTPLQRDYIAFASAHCLPEGQPPSAVGVVNNFVRDWGHVFIYDRATLEQALTNAGFVDIVFCNIDESADPELAGIDNPQRMPEGFLALESMTCEAVKPA